MSVTKQRTVYFGANLSPEEEQKNLPDIHCPLFPHSHKELNFWRSSCEARKDAKHPQCYPACKAPKTRQERVEERKEKIRTAQALHSQGLSTYAIAEKMGISRTSIRDYIRLTL